MGADTELDALNDILAATGELPVNTLDSGLPDAHMALRMLRNETRVMQGRGWWFNRESAYRATPDTEGNITLKDALDVRDPNPFQKRNLILRGHRLYDADRQTYQFDSSVALDVTWELAWDELPMVFRNYVTLRAGRRHQDNSRSSRVLHRFQVDDEEGARMQLNMTHTRNLRANSNRGSYSVNKIVSRRVNPRQV